MAAGDKKTLLILGDSLSAAYGVPRDQGWAMLLQRRLDEQGPAFTVVNASISGDTTRGGVNRLPKALAAHQPEIVVIELGGNDGLRGFGLSHTRRNLESMIDQSRAANAAVLLVGVRLPGNYGKTYREKFQALFHEVAEAKQVPLVPLLLDGVAKHRELMQADGIHPTAEAQPRLLENVWPTLLPLLRGAGETAQ